MAEDLDILDTALSLLHILDTALSLLHPPPCPTRHPFQRAFLANSTPATWSDGRLTGTAGTDRALPHGVEGSLVSARRKYEAGKPPGYDIAGMIAVAQQKRRDAKAKAAKPDEKP
jgi:hypothetical protein